MAPEHRGAEPNPRPPQHAADPVVLPSDPTHRASAETPPRHRRRVTTPPPPGSDPEPEPEQGRHSLTENDEQLKRDVPPHWA